MKKHLIIMTMVLAALLAGCGSGEAVNRKPEAVTRAALTNGISAANEIERVKGTEKSEILDGPAQKTDSREKDMDLFIAESHLKVSEERKKSLEEGKQEDVKTAEFEEVPTEEGESVPAAAETTKEDTVPSDGEAPAQEEDSTAFVEEAPVEPEQPSDRYTPEEAIAIYCSLMEAGGIKWNPEIKDVTSWGTGFIYLDKGYPEWCASTDLESFAMGDSVGHPWTEYYLEVTGSDEDAVYIIAWRC